MGLENKLGRIAKIAMVTLTIPLSWHGAYFLGNSYLSDYFDKKENVPIERSLKNVRRGIQNYIESDNIHKIIYWGGYKGLLLRERKLREKIKFEAPPRTYNLSTETRIA
jgi:hypothetical protein